MIDEPTSELNESVEEEKVPSTSSYSSDPQDTFKNIRDLEAMLELKVGETLTMKSGGTIIHTHQRPAHFGKNTEKDDIGIAKFNNQTVNASIKSYHKDPTFLEFILRTVQGFFSTFSSSLNEDEGDTELILSDEDIENLAVFQEGITEFLELHKGQVAQKKIQLMREMLTDDMHEEWDRRCNQLMPSVVLRHSMIRGLESPRAKLRAYLGTWNPGTESCSENIYLLEDQITAHRIPMVNQTDAVRSKLGVMSGIHAWDMKVTGPIGTHFSVGVATDKAPLSFKSSYVSLIGNDVESWGWDLVWGNLNHKGMTISVYPSTIIYEYTSGDIIRLVLDCDTGTLSFAVNEMPFGVAFTKLPTNTPLYPTVGLVYGNVEVSLVYWGRPPPLRNQ